MVFVIWVFVIWVFVMWVQDIWDHSLGFSAKPSICFVVSPPLARVFSLNFAFRPLPAI